MSAFGTSGHSNRSRQCPLSVEADTWVIFASIGLSCDHSGGSTRWPNSSIYATPNVGGLRELKKRSPLRAETENAVRTLIRWAGIDPYREGLAATPARVVRAYEDWFSGYHKDPREYLSRTFEKISGYDEMVLLRDITFESHCEHHLAPIIGRVHIGYLPRNRVVGISKLARMVDVYALRLQIQEKMTAEIAACLSSVLKPLGVAVVIEAVDERMTTRGAHKSEVTMVTSQMLGVFRKNSRDAP